MAVLARQDRDAVVAATSERLAAMRACLRPAGRWRVLVQPFDDAALVGPLLGLVGLASVELGDAGTLSGTNFLGTTDAQDFDIRTNDIIHHRFTQNGGIEYLNTGNSVFLGEDAGSVDDLSNNRNVFVRNQSGRLNTTGLN